jgi:hypothetical protein
LAFPSLIAAAAFTPGTTFAQTKITIGDVGTHNLPGVLKNLNYLEGSTDLARFFDGKIATPGN